jgi:hypothetical protein
MGTWEGGDGQAALSHVDEQCWRRAVTESGLHYPSASGANL